MQTVCVGKPRCRGDIIAQILFSFIGKRIHKYFLYPVVSHARWRVHGDSSSTGLRAEISAEGDWMDTERYPGMRKRVPVDQAGNTRHIFQESKSLLDHIKIPRKLHQREFILVYLPEGRKPSVWSETCPPTPPFSPLLNHFRSLLFSRSVVSDSLRLHGLQHTGLPCPSLSPGAYSNSCPVNW